MSNTCRDLETAITEEDVHFLTRNEIDTKWKIEPPPKITVSKVKKQITSIFEFN